jgi:starvation-inducible outer membrane lipoprotein
MLGKTLRGTPQQGRMMSTELLKTALNAGHARPATRIEWSGRLLVEHPVYQDTDSLHTAEEVRS